MSAAEAGPLISRNAWIRMALLLALGALFALAWTSGLDEQLSLTALREHRARLQAFTAQHPWLSLLGYVATYVVVVVFSIPGALIMTLAGGMLFGAWLGAAAAVTSATLGATVTFLIARTALGEAVRRRLGPLLSKIIEGFERNAPMYLLTLRLIPGLPFFAINLSAGVVGMRLWQFVLITIIGGTPGSIVYASIGSTLVTLFARGETPGLDIVLNWHVMGPLLGLAGLAALSAVFQTVRGRRDR